MCWRRRRTASSASALPMCRKNRRAVFPRLTVDDNLKMGAFMPGAGAPNMPSGLEFVFDPVPPHEGAPQPDGRHHVGRRAADVRDRPRA